ncbi:MAG TPA: hypothetical protein DCZ93_04585 [Elusimicrobia bacterium]|nr:hypothetical protein [Elusimicrobiota bacterium]
MTAGFDYDGTMLSASKTVKQDEIDKCRQEYIDFGIPLAEVGRSRFTLGLDMEYSKDVKDCFAYIYPKIEAQKVVALRNAGHKVKVTSGYRSPRSNILDIGSSVNSTHLFGEAVDINPIDSERNAAGWKALWVAHEATCPKSLELTPKKVMKLCNGAATVPYPGSFYPNSDDAMYPMATCIHLGNSSKLLE